MGRVNVTGAVDGGPESASAGVFPAARFMAPLSLKDSSGKQFNAATGVLVRNLQSPSAFVALDGVGAAATVTQGDFLYLKSDGPLDLRVTTDDGAGGTDVVVEPIHGLYVREFSSTKPLELLEAQGNAKIEYLVTGPS